MYAASRLVVLVWRKRTQWLKRTGVCVLSSWIMIVNIKKCYACIAKIFKPFRKEWDEKWKKYPYPSSQFIPLKMITLLIFLYLFLERKKEKKKTYFLAYLGKRDDNYLFLLFTEIIAWKFSILAHGYLPHLYSNAVFWIHYNYYNSSPIE